MSESFNKLVAEKGFQWAYALWEPTEEEREADQDRLRRLGREAAERRDEAVTKAICGEGK